MALISSSNARICLHLKLGIIPMRQKVLTPLYLSIGMKKNPVILWNKELTPLAKEANFLGKQDGFY
jgi:hypothetical protein